LSATNCSYGTCLTLDQKIKKQSRRFRGERNHQDYHQRQKKPSKSSSEVKETMKIIIRGERNHEDHHQRQKKPSRPSSEAKETIKIIIRGEKKP
jgi:hypothetical protein